MDKTTATITKANIDLRRRIIGSTSHRLESKLAIFAAIRRASRTAVGQQPVFIITYRFAADSDVFE
jgi:hypothetical protein